MIKSQIFAIIIYMNITKLKKFLANAKKNTYASGGENKAKVTSNEMKEYIFSNNGFRYIDRYKGHEKFSGEENVLENNKVVWKMKYKGEILSNKISVDDIYSFLRKALKKIPENKPFRGPKELIEKNFKYTNEIQGDIKNFAGKENIFYRDKLVYGLIYNGKIVE